MAQFNGKPATASTPTAPSLVAAGDGPGASVDLRGLVARSLSAGGLAKKASQAASSGLSGSVEAAARKLARRVVKSAMADPRDVADRDSLARALASSEMGPVIGGAAVVALAASLARRLRGATFVIKRTPLWLAAAVGPPLYASVGRGAQELGLVASNLILRARQAGVEPDAERVRRVAVQILTGVPVDPVSEPRHGQLGSRWLKRAARAAMPMTGQVRTRDPRGLATITSTVPTSSLAVINSTPPR
jgi:hypothetical protein